MIIVISMVQILNLQTYNPICFASGVCFPGWLGHSSYCYQFNAQYRMSFDGATSYCRNQGGELLRYRRYYFNRF